MFDFYELAYTGGHLTLEDLKEATKWGLITPEEFKLITGQEYSIE
ncbi:XkdX family protein [Clostridium sp. Marseille-Q7071]